MALGGSGLQGPTTGLASPVPRALLTGTAFGATEADIVTGGRTLILTLVNAEWVAAGGTFDAERQNIIDGLVATDDETDGWNDTVASELGVTDVVRTSDTVVTITLPAVANYDISATETIVATVPASAVADATDPVNAVPYLTVESLTINATVTGTATSDIDEDDIIAGGNTIIITLDNGSFVSGGFDAIRQDIIDGLVASTSQAAGWNLEVVPNIAVTDVVRTTGRIVTVTLPAVAGYDINADETVTVTVPASAINDHDEPIVAEPTFSIDRLATEAALTGTLTTDGTPENIVSGGLTAIITLDNDLWVAAGSSFDAVRQGIIDGMVSAQSEAAGWNAEVVPAIAVTDVVRTSDTVVTVTLPAVADYEITENEVITVTVPAAALEGSGVNVVASPTAEISAADPAAFITTWDTENTGTSNSDQITLPLVNGGTYNFNVDWGDGTNDDITAWDQAEKTHTYLAGAGIYTVTITGTMTRFKFNSGGDRLKVLTVEQWGSDCVYDDYEAAWRGCSNVVFNATDAPNVSACTSFFTSWQTCSSLTSIPEMDTSAGTSFSAAWQNCSSLTSFPALDVSAGTIFSNAWSGCSSLTSFPALNMSIGTSFLQAWVNCSGLTSFPLVNMSSGTDFTNAWRGCTGLTSFPALNLSAGNDFEGTWYGCSGLTSFPLVNVSSGTIFNLTWAECTGLTSFPALDMSSGININRSWMGCTSLVSFDGPITVGVGGDTFKYFQTFTNTGSIATGLVINAEYDISVASNNMNAAALDAFLTGLADLTSLTGRTVTVTGNPGVAGGYDPTIATAKNWTVVDS